MDLKMLCVDRIFMPVLLTKTWKIMKITAILMLATALQISARGISQKVTLNEKNATLESVFSKIEKQTGFSFFYKDEWLAQSKKVNITISNVSIDQALSLCFAGQPFSYTIIDQTVVVRQKDPEIIINQAFPPPITIRGKVVNQNNEPVAGVTVMVLNTKKATATDDEGEFVLYNVDPFATLSFTSTTILPLFIDVNGKTSLPVLVTTKINQLEEVVVNKGYYTEKERLSTGSVVTIKREDILKTVTTNPILALESRVPGLFINQSSGLPGTRTSAQIRGRSSLANGSEPLYIIDGIPFSPNPNSVFQYGISAAAGGISPLSTINPQDIAEITVLKDADATAIYGSRGANGVILITTKKGKTGKTSFDVDVSSGMSKVAKFADVLNAQQYLSMRNEAFKNDGSTPNAFSDYDLNGTWDTTRSTDWQKELIGGTAHLTNFQGTLSGGNENTQFSISGGYRKETLVYSRSGQSDRQGNFRSNLNHTSVNRKFSANLNIGYTSDVNTLPTQDLAGTALTLSPVAPQLFTTGDSLNWENNTFRNPLSTLFTNIKTVTNNLMGSIALNYSILPRLNIKLNTGYNKVEQNELQTIPGTSLNPFNLAQNYEQRSSAFGNNQTSSWIVEPQIDFGKTMGNGEFQVLVGTSFQQMIGKATGVQGIGYANDGQLQNLALAQTKNYQPDQYSEYKYSAVYGRMNYNWKEKYILNLTGRRDGSSRFGPGKQFGNFGSVGAAWIFTQEPWLAKSSFLNFGKLRGSYGITGNDQIQDYRFRSTYIYQYATYNGVLGLQPNQLFNADLAWEVNKKLEVALDLGLFNDRINLTANYYRNRSGNQLIDFQLPEITGFSSIIFNFPAVVQNTGFEFIVNTVNVKSTNIRWTSNFNISVPRSKLVAFPNLEESPYAQVYRVGKSLSSNQQYRFIGVNKETGVYEYDDLDKNGLINSEDYVYDKERIQRFFGGLNNSLSWKGIQLDIFIQFVKQTGNSFISAFSMPGSFSNQPVQVLDRWTKPGDETHIQKFSQLSFGSDASTAYGTFIFAGNNKIVDASFIRFKNIGLSYTIPAAIKQKMHLQNMQVYLLANNLFTITNYEGLDPSTQGRSLPPLRTLTAGIRISL